MSSNPQLPLTADRCDGTPRDAVIATVLETAVPLHELLELSLRMRETYKIAHRQSGAIGCLRLRELFDSHYLEQLRIVDLLGDAIRIPCGDSHLLALTLLREPPLSLDLWSKVTGAGWLPILFRSHDSLLRTAQSIDADAGPSKVSRPVVRQLIKTNELQAWAVGDEIVFEAGRGAIRGARGQHRP